MNNNNMGFCTGRITRDVEIRQTPGGNKFTFVNLAVGRNYKNKEGEYETDFVSFSAFGKTAEFAEAHLKKGQVISVRYELRSSTKKNDDGKTITVENKVITGFDFVPGSAKKSEDNAPAAKPEKEPQDFEELDMDDDLPF